MTVPDLVTLAGRGPVHFMGVGGAGMCALAELVVRAGGRVTGCDLKAGPNVRRLEALGAEVMRGHDASHVDGATAVVVTSAVRESHPELVRARELGVPVIKRARALGDVVNRGTVVAIAGTHGKTTTTAMTTELLIAAGLDPTGFVGGKVPAWEGNLRPGSDELFVVEADEYDRSFLTLEPDVAVVTNLEADHLDIYGDLEGLRQGFRDFLGKVRPGGRIVLCADDSGAARLAAPFGDQVVTYGLSAGAMLHAADVQAGPTEIRCRIREHGRDRGPLALRVTGFHNLRNALAAAASARHLGVSWEQIQEGLSRYQGVGRRFQLLGEIAGVVVIDDYAHHPTEIRATLEAVRAAYPERRMVAAFQPHLFSRTRDFHVEFGRALAAADVAWVTDVFPAREEPIEGVTGALVADGAREAGTSVEVHYHPAIEGLDEALAEGAREGDVLVVMGAGSIEDTGPALVQRLQGGSRG